MRITTSLMLAALLLLVMPKAASAQRYLSISDNRRGGDCMLSQGMNGPIGKWDAATKTCTLVRDVDATIQIVSDGITLDGAGFSLKPSRSVDYGVFLSNVNRVTIKNLDIQDFSIGIYSDYSNDTLVSGNTIRNNSNWGLFLFSSRNNAITNNLISDNKTGGIQMVSQSGNHLSGNIVSDNGTYGIYLGKSSTNVVRYNSIAYHTWGLTLWADSNDNLISHNVFLSNSNGHVFNEAGNFGNIFDEARPQ